MNGGVFNMSVRKSLKEFGITAQREIENTVRKSLSKRQPNRQNEAAGQDHIDLGSDQQTNLHLVVDGEIELEWLYPHCSIYPA